MSALDKFIDKHRNKTTPSDCTRLDKGENDCLERNLPAIKLCPSCAEYNRVLILWGSQPQPVKDRVAGGIQNKADAIAGGSYDKDVDWNLRDRTLWAAKLYTIADKVRSGKKLTADEHSELCDCTNYLPQDVDSVFFIRGMKLTEGA